MPLAEARLSTFLAADKDNTDDAPDAFLSGSITDANARYNLTNVVKGGKIDPIELAALQRLCETVGLSVDVAARIAAGLRDAAPPAPAARARAAPARCRHPPPADPPLMPRSARQLAWLGIEPGAVQLSSPTSSSCRRRPSSTSTPRRAKCSSPRSTASTWPTAERIVQSRQRVPIKSRADLQALAPSLPASAASTGCGSAPTSSRSAAASASATSSSSSARWCSGAGSRSRCCSASASPARDGMRLVKAVQSENQYCEVASKSNVSL